MDTKTALLRLETSRLKQQIAEIRLDSAVRRHENQKLEIQLIIEKQEANTDEIGRIRVFHNLIVTGMLEQS